MWWKGKSPSLNRQLNEPSRGKLENEQRGRPREPGGHWCSRPTPPFGIHFTRRPNSPRGNLPRSLGSIRFILSLEKRSRVIFIFPDRHRQRLDLFARGGRRRVSPKTEQKKTLARMRVRNREGALGGAAQSNEKTVAGLRERGFFLTAPLSIIVSTSVRRLGCAGLLVHPPKAAGRPFFT